MLRLASWTPLLTARPCVSLTSYPPRMSYSMLRHVEQRAIIRDFGILDPYLPITPTPSIFTPKGRRVLRKHVSSFFQSLYALSQLKLKLKDFTREGFGKEALGLYTQMNQGFGRGDVGHVEVVCCDAMASHLKREMKVRPKGVRLEWTCLEPRVRVESMRVGQLASGFSVSQIIVHIQSKQRTQVVREDGRRVGNAVEKEMEEYVVFQRFVETKDGRWQIYGKLSKQDIEAAREKMSRLPRFGAGGGGESGIPSHQRRTSSGMPVTPQRPPPGSMYPPNTAPSALYRSRGLPAPSTMNVGRDQSPSRTPGSRTMSPSGMGRGMRSINSSISSDASLVHQGRDSSMSGGTATSVASRGFGRMPAPGNFTKSPPNSVGRANAQLTPTMENESNHATRRVPSRQAAQSVSSQFSVGDRVKVDSMGVEGTLQFLGVTQFKPGIWAGIELDVVGSGKNDGSVGGVSYFSCPPSTGIFVLGSKLSRPEGVAPSESTPVQDASGVIKRPGVGLRRPGAAPTAGMGRGKPIAPQPGSRASKFANMTAQQYKRASLLIQEQDGLQESAGAQQPSSTQMKSPPPPSGFGRGLGFGRGMPRQPGLVPPMPAKPSMGGAPLRSAMSDPAHSMGPGSPGARSLSRPPGGQSSNVGPSPAQQVGMTSMSPRNSVHSSSPRGSVHQMESMMEEFAKMQVRLEVVEAENRLLKVRDQQQQAQLAASEMLERGVVVEAQAALESSGEIAALRERVESLEKERSRLEAEKDQLEIEIQEARQQRRGSMMTSITGLEELSTTEQVLKLTELISDREKRILELEEHMDMITNGNFGQMYQQIRDLQDAVAEADNALMAKEALEEDLRKEIEDLKMEHRKSDGVDGGWRERYEELEKQFEEKSIEMGQMAARLDRYSTEGEKEKAVLKETVAQLREAGQDTISAYEQRIEELQSELEAALDDQLRGSANEDKDIELLRRKNRDLDDRVLLLQAERDRLIQAGQETIEVYEVRVSQLKEELERAQMTGGDGASHGHRAAGSDGEGSRLLLEAAREELFAVKEAAARGELSRARLEKELEIARIEATRSAADAAEALEVCEKLGADLAAVRAERDALKARIDELQDSVNSSSANEDAALREALDEAERKLAEYKEQMDIDKNVREMEEMVAKEDIQRLKDELAQTLEAKEELERRIQELEATGGVADASTSGDVANLKAQLAALATRYTDMERAKQLVEAEKQVVEQNLADLAEAHRNLENDCMHLMDEVERLHNESIVSMQQLQAVTANSAGPAAAAEDADLSNVLGSLERHGDDVAEAVEQALKQKQAQMDARLQTYRDEVRRLQGRVTELEREKMMIKAQMEKEISEFESMVETKIYREAELEDRVEALEQRIESLKAQLQQAGVYVEGESTPGAVRAAITKTAPTSSNRQSVLFCDLCEKEGHDLVNCPDILGSSAVKPKLDGFGDGYDDEDDFDQPYCENCEIRGDHWTESCPTADEVF